jgi:predicted ArsR family transcriptional regulator
MTKSIRPATSFSDEVLLTTIELGSRKPLDLYKQTGISPRAAQLALDHLEADGRVVLKNGLYYTTREKGAP